MALRMFSSFALLFILIFSESSAQYQMRSNNTMVGARVGTSLGGSIKRFLNQQAAVEVMVFNRWKGWSGTMLYLHHMKIREIRGLEWYIGGGVHYGLWKEPQSEPPWVYKGTEDYKVYGIDFTSGLEYNFYNTNFYISFDWKPAYNFVDFTRLWWDEAAFSFKYSF